MSMKKEILPYRILLAVFALFLLISMLTASLAETERGDLNERFSDEITVEYADIVYRLRDRLTTVMFAGFAADDAGEYVPEMLLLLAVNDNEKLMSPIWIECALLPEYIPIYKDVAAEFIEIEGVDIRCEELLGMANALMPAELIEHYIALDLASLELLDGLDTPNYTERIKALKAQLEQSSSEQLDEMFDRMSGHIVTDMKSGALIKIADKAERYDRRPTVRFVKQPDIDNPDDSEVAYSQDAMLEFAVKVFFEEKQIW